MNKKIRGSALAAIICALLLAFSAAFIFSGGVVSTPVSSAEEQQDATFISGIDNLAVTQVVNGHGAWENDDTFSFSIKAKEKYQGVTLPKDTKVVITKDTPNHVAAFGDIIFTKEGTYDFIISAMQTNSAKYTYDADKDRTVQIVVYRGADGYLSAKKHASSENLVFTNTILPEAPADDPTVPSTQPQDQQQPAVPDQSEPMPVPTPEQQPVPGSDIMALTELPAPSIAIAPTKVETGAQVTYTATQSISDSAANAEIPALEMTVTTNKAVTVTADSYNLSVVLGDNSTLDLSASMSDKFEVTSIAGSEQTQTTVKIPTQISLADINSTFSKELTNLQNASLKFTMKATTMSSLTDLADLGLTIKDGEAYEVPVDVSTLFEGKTTKGTTQNLLINIPQSEITVSKKSSASNVNVGVRVEYTVTVTNTGAGPANNLTINDNIDNALATVPGAGIIASTVKAEVGSDGNYKPVPAGNIAGAVGQYAITDLNVGTLASHQSAILTYQVQYGLTTSVGLLGKGIDNTVKVTWDGMTVAPVMNSVKTNILDTSGIEVELESTNALSTNTQNGTGILGTNVGGVATFRLNIPVDPSFGSTVLWNPKVTSLALSTGNGEGTLPSSITINPESFKLNGSAITPDTAAGGYTVDIGGTLAELQGYTTDYNDSSAKTTNIGIEVSKGLTITFDVNVGTDSSTELLNVDFDVRAFLEADNLTTVSLISKDVRILSPSVDMVKTATLNGTPISNENQPSAGDVVDYKVTATVSGMKGGVLHGLTLTDTLQDKAGESIPTDTVVAFDDLKITKNGAEDPAMTSSVSPGPNGSVQLAATSTQNDIAVDTVYVITYKVIYGSLDTTTINGKTFSGKAEASSVNLPASAKNSSDDVSVLIQTPMFIVSEFVDPTVINVGDLFTYNVNINVVNSGDSTCAVAKGISLQNMLGLLADDGTIQANASLAVDRTSVTAALNDEEIPITVTMDGTSGFTITGADDQPLNIKAGNTISLVFEGKAGEAPNDTLRSKKIVNQATAGCTNIPETSWAKAAIADNSTVQIASAILNVNKTTSAPTVALGENIAYTVSIANVDSGHSESLAKNLTVIDELDLTSRSLGYKMVATSLRVAHQVGTTIQDITSDCDISWTGGEAFEMEIPVNLSPSTKEDADGAAAPVMVKVDSLGIYHTVSNCPSFATDESEEGTGADIETIAVSEAKKKGYTPCADCADNLDESGSALVDQIVISYEATTLDIDKSTYSSTLTNTVQVRAENAAYQTSTAFVSLDSGSPDDNPIETPGTIEGGSAPGGGTIPGVGGNDSGMSSFTNNNGHGGQAGGNWPGMQAGLNSMLSGVLSKTGEIIGWVVLGIVGAAAVGLIAFLIYRKVRNR